MKRFILIQLVSLLLAVIFFTSSAMAIGLGFYLNPGIFGGKAYWTRERDDINSSNDFDKDTDHIGGGFVLDTAVAKNSVFNYRLNIGYEKFSHKNGDELDLEGLVIGNTFGFAPSEKQIVQRVRLWLGPQIRLSIFQGSPEGDSELDINLFGYGIGFVCGVNFNIGKVFTPALTFGYLYSSYVGTGKRKNYDYEIDYDMTEHASLLIWPFFLESVICINYCRA